MSENTLLAHYFFWFQLRTKLFSNAGYAAKMHKIKMLRNLKKTNLKKRAHIGHTYTSPPQYVTHAHSLITRAVEAMDSCSAYRHCDTAVRMLEVLARPGVWCMCAPCFKFVLEILLLSYNFMF